MDNQIDSGVQCMLDMNSYDLEFKINPYVFGK